MISLVSYIHSYQKLHYDLYDSIHGICMKLRNLGVILDSFIFKNGKVKYFTLLAQ